MTTAPPERLLSARYAPTTIGMFALIVFVAFEALAVTTVMPSVARLLDGEGLYALSFAAPLASGVIGTVVGGIWSDRRGPVPPLLASLALFSFGLLVCALAVSMEMLVVGRVLQGLGGGALTVGLYVLVGTVFPSSLQPAVFASFAAAWVLPALFGPALAAVVADALGWRWVFGGAVVLVAFAALMITPALRGLRHESEPSAVPRSRLVWATAAAVAVLAVEMLGSAHGWAGVGAIVPMVVVVVALQHLLPPGTLAARPGLPAVVATRGLLGSTFFCAEAYVVYVLSDHWGLSASRAGLALTGVGLVWASASQVQARLGARLAHTRAMRIGTALVLAGIIALALSVWLHLPAVIAGASYVLAGAGMGLGFPRTSVAVLDVSTDADRGFNSAALSIADSLGAAIALALSGVAFALAQRAGLDPFLAVFVLAGSFGVLGVVAAGRARVRAAA